MLSRLKRISGFSLVEIMVATGLISVLAYAVMSMVSRATNAGKDAEIKLQTNEVLNQMRVMLVDKRACENSFAGTINLNGTSVASPVAVTNLKNKYNTVQFTTTGTYSSGAVQINSMSTYRSAGANGSVATAVLNIGFKLLLGPNKGRVVPLSLTYYADTDASGLVTTCFADVDNAIQTACSQIGGTLNNTTGYCQLFGFTVSATTTAPTVTSSAVSTDYLYQYIMALNLPSTYVKKIGDTMTGSLSITAAGTGLSVTNAMTVGGNLGVGGILYATGGATIANSLTVNGIAGYSGVDDTSTSPLPTGDLNFASHKYVWSMIAANLTATQTNAIADQVMQQVTSSGYYILRDAVRDSIDDNTMANTSVTANRPRSCAGTDKASGFTCDTNGCYLVCTADQDTITSVSFDWPTCLATANEAIASISISPASGLNFTITCSKIAIPQIIPLYGGTHNTIQCSGIGGAPTYSSSLSAYFCIMPNDTLTCPTGFGWSYYTPATGIPINYYACTVPDSPTCPAQSGSQSGVKCNLPACHWGGLCCAAQPPSQSSSCSTSVAAVSCVTSDGPAVNIGDVGTLYNHASSCTVPYASNSSSSCSPSTLTDDAWCNGRTCDPSCSCSVTRNCSGYSFSNTGSNWQFSSSCDRPRRQAICY